MDVGILEILAKFRFIIGSVFMILVVLVRTVFMALFAR